MPQSDEDKKTKLKQKIAKAQQELRRLATRERSQTERARTHAAIVVGLGMIEHVARNPGSEVRRVAIRLCENWLAQRPEDQAVVDLLAKLNAPPPSPAAVPEAAE